MGLAGTLNGEEMLASESFLKDWRLLLNGMKQKCDRSLTCVVIQANIADMTDNALLDSIASQDA